MDSELKEYLDRLRQENMKAHVETWRQIAALEKRIVEDNAASHTETRLHVDETVEQLDLIRFSLKLPAQRRRASRRPRPRRPKRG